MTDIIGSSTLLGKGFDGSFDGNNKRIHLQISSSEEVVGLFGVVDEWATEIKNVIVYGSVVGTKPSGVQFVAGVAAMTYAPIVNCINMASIQSNSSAAGIVGQLRPDNGVYVNNCINIGKVIGVVYSGGIVANIYSSGTAVG